jgi:hypothetical protein
MNTLKTCIKLRTEHGASWSRSQSKPPYCFIKPLTTTSRWRCFMSKLRNKTDYIPSQLAPYRKVGNNPSTWILVRYLSSLSTISRRLIFPSSGFCVGLVLCRWNEFYRNGLAPYSQGYRDPKKIVWNIYYYWKIRLLNLSLTQPRHSTAGNFVILSHHSYASTYLVTLWCHHTTAQTRHKLAQAWQLKSDAP